MNQRRAGAFVAVPGTCGIRATISASLDAAIGTTNLILSNNFGLAAQAGTHFDLAEQVFLNLDVKYIDMSPTARLTTGTLVNAVDVKINPIVAGVSVGMRF